MARKRKRKKGQEPSPEAVASATKEDIVGWTGGVDLDLDREMDCGRKLRDVLGDHIDEVLDQEIRNQTTLLNDMSEWQRQYKGYREDRNFPFERSANTAVPLTRSAADAVYVRLEDTLYGRKKIYLLQPTVEGIDDLVADMEDGLQWYLDNKLDFRRAMRDPLKQAVKIGTGPTMVDWVEERETRVRYATKEEEESLPASELYKLSGTDSKGVKAVIETYKGPKVFGIRREDWVMSSDADEPRQSYLCGFKKYYRKVQVELKVRQNLWDAEAVDKIINPESKGSPAPDSYDEVKEDRAEIEGKELIKTEYEYPYEIWQLWTSFDVDEDGEEDSIVTYFHKASKQVLRGHYNHLFSKFRPFELLKGYPLEYSGDGEGVCGILYKLQVELDTIHNQRQDRMTEINAPLVFVRRGTGLDNYKINPGHVEVVDEDLEASIRIEHFPGVYYSTEREEDRTLDYGYRAIGIAPENIGVTVADRPVFKEAMARLQEANKVFQSLKNNIIESYQRIGKMIIEYFGQYEPEYTYLEKVVDQNGAVTFEEKKVSFPLDSIWTGMKVELYASRDIMNVDLRREINMTVYQMMSDYMTNSAGMVQAILSQEVPSDFKEWLKVQYEIGVTIMRKILEDFDQQDVENMAKSLGDVIDIEGAIANSIDKFQAQQAIDGANGNPDQQVGGPMPIPQGAMMPQMPSPTG